MHHQFIDFKHQMLARSFANMLSSTNELIDLRKEALEDFREHIAKIIKFKDFAFWLFTDESICVNMSKHLMVFEDVEKFLEYLPALQEKDPEAINRMLEIMEEHNNAENIGSGNCAC